MFNAVQFKDYILNPVLQSLHMSSDEAVTLMLGTLATESKGGTFLHQVNGPALGIFQMEPKTHDDIWDNYLSRQPVVTYRLMLQSKLQFRPRPSLMINDLFYATAMARIHYWRVSEPMPSDLSEIAKYYKKYYNTINGKNTPEKFIKDYEVFIGARDDQANRGRKGKD